MFQQLTGMSLLIHDLFKGKVTQVENCGEIEVRIDLIILERIEVKLDSLQVYNQNVRWFSNQLSLFNIDLL
jgi:hypothetical protein